VTVVVTPVPVRWLWTRIAEAAHALRLDDARAYEIAGDSDAAVAELRRTLAMPT
jgi:hypothetical protein